jgi:hypothetical protein
MWPMPTSCEQGKKKSFAGGFNDVYFALLGVLVLDIVYLHFRFLFARSEAGIKD